MNILMSIGLRTELSLKLVFFTNLVSDVLFILINICMILIVEENKVLNENLG